MNQTRILAFSILTAATVAVTACADYQQRSPLPTPTPYAQDVASEAAAAEAAPTAQNETSPGPAGSLETATKRPASKPAVNTGIEVLVSSQSHLVAGKRIGLITNQTGVSSDLRSDYDLISSVPGARVTAFFAGEHGLRGAEEAGKKLEGFSDPYTGVPVYSLYGGSLAPKQEWLRDVDVLVFDIQNVGSAIYTYKFTMSFAMEAAAKARIPFIVLDRPNPAGGTMVEGPIVQARDIWRHPLPLRHGMTNGELATMWNQEYTMGADLAVVKMDGWRREMTWDETGLPWVSPSPNMPTADTALAYAGQGLIESVSNISEGRGTTRPFLLSGAPGLDAIGAAAELNARKLPGVVFRPAYFQPSKAREKFDGLMCGGVELYFTDRQAYRAVLTTLNVLDVYRQFSGQNIAAKPGSLAALPDGSSIAQRVASYQQELASFLKVRQKYLLY